MQSSRPLTDGDPLDVIFFPLQEIEQAILEPGTLFLRKLSESDQTVASLFQTVASDTSLETYTIEVRDHARHFGFRHFTKGQLPFDVGPVWTT